MKRIRFWGTRGSLPVALTAAALRAKLLTTLRRASGRIFASESELASFVDGLEFAATGTYGGHSSCVELDTGGPDTVICDLGSGLRPLGQAALARGGTGPRTYRVFLSHLHWDHIMGLPFFAPAYVPGNRIIVYGGHANLEDALRRQQQAPSFPVDFSTFRASFEFVRLEPDRPYDIGDCSVRILRQQHAGDSYGFRFTANGRSVVYSTDSEHTLAEPGETARFVEFFRDADVVIFDAMYSLADSISVRADWGHSSNVVGVELCQLAAARHLCLFHHEPASDDEALDRVLAQTRRLEEITRTGDPLTITAAYDGMELAL